MKNKYSIPRYTFAALGIILSAVLFLSNGYNKKIMLYMITSLGLFQTFNGLYFYDENKKFDGIMSILCGIFILGVVIKMALL